MLDIKLKLRPGHVNERNWMAPSPLRKLFWNVTYACNYRCGVCFADAGTRDPDELTTEEGKAVFRNAHAGGVRDIIISGGEPFMRADLLELLAYAADLGITTRIASNGSLLSDEVLKRLRRETLTKSFQISLDTLDPDLYGAFHGCPPGALESALEALRHIQSHGFHTTVSVRLTAQTLPGIPQILDRACAEGWSTVTVHCPVLTRRTEGAWPQEADVLSFLEPVFEHFLTLRTKWLVETYIPWAPYHAAIQRLGKHIRVAHRGCRAGRDRLTVNPTGWISPCVTLDVPQAYVGNVRHDDLAEVFAKAPICEMMRRPQEHGICGDCPKVSVCGGGCRAAAFAVTGRLDGQDPSCPLRLSRVSRVAGAHERS